MTYYQLNSKTKVWGDVITLYSGHKTTKLEQGACNRFCNKYHNEEDRLIAIMKNVIRNNGDFVIPRWAIRAAKKESALELAEYGD